MQWLPIIAIDALGPGERYMTMIKGYAVVIVNEAGQFYAFEDNCPHQGLPISDGTIEQQEIECPFHGAKFSIITGEVRCPPAFDNLTVFEVKTMAGMVHIQL
jgi:3-phenylpropionate/trans-cinnamate dioxygenase ferredoxin subunit